MKKEQIIGFLKAPFSKSFITSYLFHFFVLLSVPFCSHLLGLLFQNVKKIEQLSEEELSPFLGQLLFQNIHFYEVLMAGIGIICAYILLSSYALLLTHKTAISKKGLFNAERFSFSFAEIIATVPKLLCFSLLCILASFFLMGALVLVSTLLITFGMMISKVLGVLLICLCVFVSIYLVCRGICYLLTFSFIFHKDFCLGDFFCYHKIQTFFTQHKKKIFIAWLLCFVIGQMANTLYTAIGASIFEKVLIASGVLQVFHLSAACPLVLGILVWGFCVTYLTLLQAIILGKAIVWITKK